MKKTYKKFNLEEALNGAKLETREGLKVKAIHLIENTNNTNPLVVVLENTDGDDITNCTVNGRFWNNNCDSSLDLFIVEEPKVYYLNVYKDNRTGTGDVTVGGNIFFTFEEARESAVESLSMNYLKTISFTDELENPCEKIDVDTDTMKEKALKDISSIFNCFGYELK
jgi:hypothetical protein